MTVDKYFLLAALLFGLIYGFKLALECQEGNKSIRARVAANTKGARS
ncbi:MAG TPA: hypothetical protein VM577_09380 [Anaerovoracaceae bacterium]|nr:hypothetical protein [Anaerovoracaceae bacterium]